MSSSLVEKILETRHEILVYPQTSEELARSVMHEVAERLATEMSVSDPNLDGLVIVDTAAHLEDWISVVPTAHVTTVRQLSAGEDVIGKHQAVVSLSPEFLRRKEFARAAWFGAPRFYAMSPRLESVLPFMSTKRALRLQEAAA